jgi:hypothetical protein
MTFLTAGRCPTERECSATIALNRKMTGVLARFATLAIIVLSLSVCVTHVVKADEPLEVTPRQLLSDPGTYNHKLIRVTGFVSHSFEDFTLTDPTFSSENAIWLEYGGAVASDTVYCCGPIPGQVRPESLTVEGVRVPLTKDRHFRRFDRLVNGQDSVVRATIVGRFFAGERTAGTKVDTWGGYGHLGCCSLLAIQRVGSVDPHDRTDLDYRASVDEPKLSGVGCSYGSLLRDGAFPELLAQQRDADAGNQPWRFRDPRRVAIDALVRLLRVDEAHIRPLRLVRQAQGRRIFKFKPGRGDHTYMVVVSRPYWVSHYATDSRQVAWTVIGVFESLCP